MRRKQRTSGEMDFSTSGSEAQGESSSHKSMQYLLPCQEWKVMEKVRRKEVESTSAVNLIILQT